MRSKLNIILAS